MNSGWRYSRKNTKSSLGRNQCTNLETILRKAFKGITGRIFKRILKSILVKINEVIMEVIRKVILGRIPKGSPEEILKEFFMESQE